MKRFFLAVWLLALLQPLYGMVLPCQDLLDHVYNHYPVMYKKAKEDAGKLRNFSEKITVKPPFGDKYTYVGFSFSPDRNDLAWVVEVRSGVTLSGEVKSDFWYWSQLMEYLLKVIPNRFEFEITLKLNYPIFSGIAVFVLYVFQPDSREPETHYMRIGWEVMEQVLAFKELGLVKKAERLFKEAYLPFDEAMMDTYEESLIHASYFFCEQYIKIEDE